MESFKFRPSMKKYLEGDDSVVTVKILKMREVGIVLDEQGMRTGRFDDGRVFLMTLAAPARVNIRKLKKALDEQFNTFCQHSYDCCGNWYCTILTYKLRRIKSGTWTVPLSYHCNV